METLRSALETDLEEIQRLEEIAFSDPWTKKSLTETFLQPQSMMIVSKEDEKLNGYCILYYVLDEGEIARIAVAPTCRRNGVGRRMLDYVVTCCKKKGIQKLLLDVRRGNLGARAFYESYGFTEDGIRKGFYENPREDGVLMSKLMESPEA